MMNRKIIHLTEPRLLFGEGQMTEDPRDGLLLYGPYENWNNNGNKFNSHTISIGLIGTTKIYEKYLSFIKTIKAPIYSKKKNKRYETVSNERQRPSFPGFEAVFNIHLPDQPDKFIEIKEIELYTILKNEKNKQIRTNKLVDLYLEKIISFAESEDCHIDIWIVVVPKEIFIRCRSNSFGKEFSKETLAIFDLEEKGQTSLFTEEEIYGEEISKYFDTSSDFHHLLKARSNQEKVPVPIQILVESKLEFRDILTNQIYSDDMKAFLAWSLSTTIYYKLGKKPWKIADIREGVCYLGLVFKKFQNKKNKHLVCSAAQLFLSDGDGTVFRGNNGLWLSEKPNEFHLDSQEAFNLLDLALNDFRINNNETYPKELFIHGRASFNDVEWQGFEKAINKHNCTTALVGIIIKDSTSLKLFREIENEKANYGVLRGLAWIINDKEAFLFTRGFIPRLGTSMSIESPNPLHIKIARGNTDLEKVLNDIMALTKVNYNTCIYGDGKPVTLRFSDSIGSILTATENYKEERRQFKFYI